MTLEKLYKECQKKDSSNQMYLWNLFPDLAYLKGLSPKQRLRKLLC